ncbi:MAG: Ig-like domain-containing protein [Candidatus Brocadiales bacterium]|nr:Ig-like domain-containing protein [Candidatus Brocadiales bacterium]MBL7110154.1 hypothetical protein [Candidatus Neomarinimicrobiota bacterium]
MKKFIVLLSLIIFSCEDSKDENNQVNILKIVNPVSGETVSENVNIVVEYEGDKTMSIVRYIFNDELFTDVNNYPFVYTWNTFEWTNGSYYLYAIGYFNEQDSILSNTVSGQIYNELPADPLVVFDNSAFPPYDYGYKYSVRTENKDCGNGPEPYPYLTFTAAIKNIGGQTAYNVKVSLTISVTSNINTNLTFGETKDFGTVAANESKGLSFDNRFKSMCQYGPYSVQNFSEINISEIVANITWN